LLIFYFDFIAMIFVRMVFEKKFYLRRWWTYKLGDSVFLPLYGFFAATILHATVIQTNFWWSIILIVLGITIMLSTEILHVEEKFYKLQQELLPSQIYHAIIFVVMFYLVGSSLPYVILLHSPIWSFIGVIIALSGYLITVVIDYSVKKNIKRSQKKRKR
jgi:hypothetical protein